MANTPLIQDKLEIVREGCTPWVSVKRGLQLTHARIRHAALRYPVTFFRCQGMPNPATVDIKNPTNMH